MPHTVEDAVAVAKLKFYWGAQPLTTLHSQIAALHRACAIANSISETNTIACQELERYFDRHEHPFAGEIVEDAYGRLREASGMFLRPSQRHKDLSAVSLVSGLLKLFSTDQIRVSPVLSVLWTIIGSTLQGRHPGRSSADALPLSDKGLLHVCKLALGSAAGECVQEWLLERHTARPIAHSRPDRSTSQRAAAAQPVRFGLLLLLLPEQLRSSPASILDRADSSSQSFLGAMLRPVSNSKRLASAEDAASAADAASVWFLAACDQLGLAPTELIAGSSEQSSQTQPLEGAATRSRRMQAAAGVVARSVVERCTVRDLESISDAVYYAVDQRQLEAIPALVSTAFTTWKQEQQGLASDTSSLSPDTMTPDRLGQWLGHLVERGWAQWRGSCAETLWLEVVPQALTAAATNSVAPPTTVRSLLLALQDRVRALRGYALSAHQLTIMSQSLLRRTQLHRAPQTWALKVTLSPRRLQGAVYSMLLDQSVKDTAPLRTLLAMRDEVVMRCHCTGLQPASLQACISDCSPQPAVLAAALTAEGFFRRVEAFEVEALLNATLPPQPSSAAACTVILQALFATPPLLDAGMLGPEPDNAILSAVQRGRARLSQTCDLDFPAFVEAARAGRALCGTLVLAETFALCSGGQGYCIMPTADVGVEVVTATGPASRRTQATVVEFLRRLGAQHAANWVSHARGSEGRRRVADPQCIVVSLGLSGIGVTASIPDQHLSSLLRRVGLDPCAYEAHDWAHAVHSFAVRSNARVMHEVSGDAILTPAIIAAAVACELPAVLGSHLAHVDALQAKVRSRFGNVSIHDEAPNEPSSADSQEAGLLGLRTACALAMNRFGQLPGALFDSLDADGDGYITRSAFRDWLLHTAQARAGHLRDTLLYDCLPSLRPEPILAAVHSLAVAGWERSDGHVIHRTLFVRAASVAVHASAQLSPAFVPWCIASSLSQHVVRRSATAGDSRSSRSWQILPSGPILQALNAPHVSKAYNHDAMSAGLPQAALRHAFDWMRAALQAAAPAGTLGATALFLSALQAAAAEAVSAEATRWAADRRPRGPLAEQTHALAEGLRSLSRALSPYLHSLPTLHGAASSDSGAGGGDFVSVSDLFQRLSHTSDQRAAVLGRMLPASIAAARVPMRLIWGWFIHQHPAAAPPGFTQADVQAALSDTAGPAALRPVGERAMEVVDIDLAEASPPTRPSTAASGTAATGPFAVTTQLPLEQVAESAVLRRLGSAHRPSTRGSGRRGGGVTDRNGSASVHSLSFSLFKRCLLSAVPDSVRMSDQALQWVFEEHTTADTVPPSMPLRAFPLAVRSIAHSLDWAHERLCVLAERMLQQSSQLQTLVMGQPSERVLVDVVVRLCAGADGNHDAVMSPSELRRLVRAYDAGPCTSSEAELLLRVAARADVVSAPMHVWARLLAQYLRASVASPSTAHASARPALPPLHQLRIAVCTIQTVVLIKRLYPSLEAAFEAMAGLGVRQASMKRFAHWLDGVLRQFGCPAAPADLLEAWFRSMVEQGRGGWASGVGPDAYISEEGFTRVFMPGW